MRPEWCSDGWPLLHLIFGAPRVHLTIVGAHGELDNFDQPCGDLGASPMGDRCMPACPHPLKVFTFEKRK